MSPGQGLLRPTVDKDDRGARIGSGVKKVGGVSLARETLTANSDADGPVPLMTSARKRTVICKACLAIEAPPGCLKRVAARVSDPNGEGTVLTGG